MPSATDRPLEVTEPLPVAGGPGTSAPFVSTDTEIPASATLAETETAAVIVPTDEPASISQLTIGSYIQFGRYNGEPILWRVIEDSANPNALVGDEVLGDPLLFSSTVITSKAFDAAGPHGGDTQRLNGGSNQWATSSLRDWLNSTAGAGEIVWLDGNPPLEGSVEENPYADEEGFISPNHFSAEELNMI